MEITNSFGQMKRLWNNNASYSESSRWVYYAKWDIVAKYVFSIPPSVYCGKWKSKDRYNSWKPRDDIRREK